MAIGFTMTNLTVIAQILGNAVFETGGSPQGAMSPDWA